jgi:DNA primase catalytic subunit
MIHISTLLKHYKRRDIQEAMVLAAEGREVAVKYGDKGFGKRPDVLQYPRDVLEFAKKGATSFHVSEERWKRVMQISTGMRRQEMDELRKGWDLVLDIDCPLWDYSRYITHLIVQILKKHGIKSVTVKFSGNKGFHIAVPFEAFPKEVNGNPTAVLFPDGVRRVALFIADQIEPQLIQYVKQKEGLAAVAEKLGIAKESLHKIVCTACKRETKIKKGKVEFVCTHCETKEPGNLGEKYRLCRKCNKIMERIEQGDLQRCIYCKNTTIEEKLDITPLLQIDTVLISSRHLYRMPYSLHEKSGLCSVPVDIDNILSFEREDAHPDKVKVEGNIGFLESGPKIAGEAQRLLLEAFDYKPVVEDKGFENSVEKAYKKFDDEELQEAIPADLFPPCIKLGLKGMKDGKKRFMFVLVNFLRSVGYDYDAIDLMLEEWNKKNPEALREVLIKGHVRYARQHNKKVLPPNCNNQGYYKDMGLCHPDGFCARIKNPAQYSKQRAFIANLKNEKGKREKLTDEQKEMRRKYREKRKSEEPGQVMD